MTSERRPADHDGVPMCSHMVCPQYSTVSTVEGGGKTIERCAAMPGRKLTDVCVPEVRAMSKRMEMPRFLGAVDKGAQAAARLISPDYLYSHLRTLSEKERDEFLADLGDLRYVPPYAVLGCLQITMGAPDWFYRRAHARLAKVYPEETSGQIRDRIERALQYGDRGDRR